MYKYSAILPFILYAMVASGVASADLAISDSVFAHDFEIISGNTITGLVGPAATKSSNVGVSGTDPLSFSSQHVQGPNGLAYGSIDTTVQLTSNITAISFSIFYNDRGDNGGDGSSKPGRTRLLSSYIGTGAPNDRFAFETREASSGTERHLRIFGGGEDVVSTASTPTQDGLWHQAGFVIDSGLLTFYFDGNPLGSSQMVTGLDPIPAQAYNWFLMEDATSASNTDEYFDLGSYDEAALWYRALSPSEMSALYSNGLANAVPEPSTAPLICIAACILSIVWFSRKRPLSASI